MKVLMFSGLIIILSVTRFSYVTCDYAFLPMPIFIYIHIIDMDV